MFDKSDYVGLYEDGEEICEHVPFNQKLRKSGAKLYKSRLINANITEHSEPATFWKIMRRKIKKISKNFFRKIINKCQKDKWKIFKDQKIKKNLN